MTRREKQILSYLSLIRQTLDDYTRRAIGHDELVLANDPARALLKIGLTITDIRYNMEASYPVEMGDRGFRQALETTLEQAFTDYARNNRR